MNTDEKLLKIAQAMKERRVMQKAKLGEIKKMPITSVKALADRVARLEELIDDLFGEA